MFRAGGDSSSSSEEEEEIEVKEETPEVAERERDVATGHVAMQNVDLKSRGYHPVKTLSDRDNRLVILVDDNYGERWVLKMVRLDKEMNILNEHARETMISQLDHPNLVKVNQIFIHANSMCFRMDYYGADLQQYVKQLNEGTIKSFMRDILNGLKYMHKLGIIHRDMKPNNILVDTHENIRKALIADFDAARFFLNSGVRLTGEIGTLTYRAPEILLGSVEYDTSVDIWAAGLIFFYMLTGKHFLKKHKEKDCYLGIARAFGFPSEDTWPGVSTLPKYMEAMEVCSTLPGPIGIEECLNLTTIEPAKDLIEKMLQLDPSKRISANAALEHEYFKN